MENKALIIDRVNSSISDDTNNVKSKKDKDNPSFIHEIKKASFYFQDKFIVLCSGNSLNFYKYEMSNKNCKDDVKRLQSKGAYKLVQKYENTDTHSIPSYCLHNNLKSHIGILGWSNKELIVYDVNYNKELSAFSDLHDKMIHTLDFFNGSYREDSNWYNLFYTASTDNFIRIWDLRTWEPVREFNDHVNRGNQIGCGISNCLRYLISGSEDRAV